MYRIGGRRLAVIAGGALLLLALARAAVADKADDALDLAEADRLNAIWSIAEAEIIAERCPYAKIDEQVRADIIERSHIDLQPNSEDGKLFAFRLEERRDHFWPRSEHEMCLHAAFGYGPRGSNAKDLLKLRKPYKE